MAALLRSSCPSFMLSLRCSISRTTQPCPYSTSRDAKGGEGLTLVWFDQLLNLQLPEYQVWIAVAPPTSTYISRTSTVDIRAVNLSMWLCTYPIATPQAASYTFGSNDCVLRSKQTKRQINNCTHANVQTPWQSLGYLTWVTAPRQATSCSHLPPPKMPGGPQTNPLVSREGCQL